MPAIKIIKGEPTPQEVTAIEKALLQRQAHAVKSSGYSNSERKT